MAMRWESFLQRVEERGEYPDPKHAEEAVRVVLGLLGAHLVGEERAQLAAPLPQRCSMLLLAPAAAAEPLGPEQFLRAAAPWIDGASQETVHRDVGAVLSVVAEAADPELMERVLLQLPPGYDLFFARPDRL
ncbi:hypothetical protein GCM10010193_01470 [Kitasatospora atroaurantiaca]|uniref:Uncharacterized protein (DUF2267 family) n=1 Tax=Kitasatospora atroaurantiaca TaxID=285545 RepID=A0A561EL77_9ACTN|nr:DUF2267 domain-containing protein [Kitasatospora atroaurantiaca]TWE16370.1 uncharacterized protein (DUF2267 family) [Kitasatospora atroaurantiaca]